MRKRTEPLTEHSRVFGQVETIPERKALEYDINQKRRDWLDPIGMSQLKRAVEKKRDKAIIHGIEYNLTYGDSIRSKVLGNDNPVVKVKRADGILVPFGYVSIDRILKFEFEEGKG